MTNPFEDPDGTCLAPINDEGQHSRQLSSKYQPAGLSDASTP
jgi:uncharacterized protein YbdZ (MbtH family)